MRGTRWQRVLTALCAVALGSGAAGAVIRTVGPGGTHATIQAAVDAAIAAGGDSDIRVAKGTYPENVVVGPAPGVANLDIRGGWEPGFRSRSSDPAETVVDGGGSGRPFFVEIGSGRLRIEGLTLTNGLASYDQSGPFPEKLPEGGGLRAELSRRAGLILVDNLVTRNRSVNKAPPTGYAHGGGILVFLEDSSTLEMEGNRVFENRAESIDVADATAGGGGLHLVAGNGATVTVRDNRFERNVARAGSEQITGAGVQLRLDGDARALFHGNVVSDNRAERAGATGPDVGVGGALWVTGGGNATLDARRNAWVDNGAKGPSTSQVSLSCSGAGTLYFTDSVVTGGGGDGISAGALAKGSLHLTNLTVVDNGGEGVELRADPGARMTLFNSVLYRNGTDLEVTSGSPGLGANLVGTDPLFRDLAARNYRLRPMSPAIDAGQNPLVPSERLGAEDLEGNARVANGVVDQGAYESGSKPPRP